MKERNIAVCIILTVVTCGIYGIYWMYCIVEESNTMTGADGPGGVAVILLTIVTCSIYGWYWSYTVGKRLDELAESEGGQSSNYGVLFLVLAIFELSIVNYCIIQNEINKRATA